MSIRIQLFCVVVLSLISGLAFSSQTFAASSGLQLLATDFGVEAAHQRLLEILTNPDLFYVLFIAGLLGIALELLHPGLLFPGILGSISLILAFVASTVLPINYSALGLILLSVAFMVAEIFVPAFGLLGIGGFVGFIIGSMMVIDNENSMGMYLSLYTIIPICLIVVAVFLLVGFLLIKSQRARAATGGEALLQQIGVASENFQGREGLIRIDGELWAAELIDDSVVKRGDKIMVMARSGLKLTIQPYRT